MSNVLDHQREITRLSKSINKLNKVIDWELFRKELESLLGYDQRDEHKGGRPPFDPVFMLKVLVLQTYYGLRSCLRFFYLPNSAQFAASAPF